MGISDVLIIGSGVAALQLASLVDSNKKVTIITKSNIRNANSYLAQGGIAAAVGTNDHPAHHAKDTLEAGRFHNCTEAVEAITFEAPEMIKEFSVQSDIFDKDENGNISLGLEGAHSEKRILHSGGDATGKRVIDYLLATLQSNVQVEQNMFAYELVMDRKQNRCIGVKVKDENNQIQSFYGTHVVLASGGCGGIYPFTSNDGTITGDGIAMAYLAGAEIADMEFIQFHPTILYKDEEAKGLISEAVRGEGAILVTEDGYLIMENVHPLKDLAPRHVISQTVYHYIQNWQRVFLDISKIKNFEERFPSITAICHSSGINLSEKRIPVAPGSHFTMGGVKADLMGRTSVNGLYAIGEVACTGFHGANRLASNSLLECFYLGTRLAQWINENRTTIEIQTDSSFSKKTHKEKLVLPDLQVLKNSMMERVGIVRSKELLEEQLNWLDSFQIKEDVELDRYTKEELTVLFMCINARLITEGALRRTESRGGHFRSDCTSEVEEWCGKQIIQSYKGEVLIYNE